MQTSRSADYKCQVSQFLSHCRTATPAHKFCVIIYISVIRICTSLKLQPPVYPQINLIALTVFAKFVIQDA